MTTTLTHTQKRGNTLVAIRENFDLYPADWQQAVCNAERLARFIDDCADAYVESEPERYASLTKLDRDVVAEVAVQRFAAAVAST